ncbi:hypothetical protein CH263_20070 [Rhodococcus sp. 06-1059B-a]|nr:hypothetical protein [Rhodococcus sp. 06-1059B-a]OZD60791.1 hypothetical protein CH263_20070 [Rhodococcus sp. 06-1059B-a]
MNILIARAEHRRARKILFADYTDQNVTDYTTIALLYSDHRTRVLNGLAFLLFAAAFGLALYNFTLLWRGGADNTLLVLTFGTLGAAFAVRTWARGTAAATNRTINSTVLTASYEAAPSEAVTRRQPPETGESH